MERDLTRATAAAVMNRSGGDWRDPAPIYFFLTSLSLAFTWAPRVGAAFGAALSFFGLRVSLLLRA
jgi:hypothetical protein